MNRCPRCRHKKSVIKPDPTFARLRRCVLCWIDWVGLYEQEMRELGMTDRRYGEVVSTHPTPYEEQHK